MKNQSALTRNMQSLDEETKNSLLVWMLDALYNAGISDPDARQAVMERLTHLTEIPDGEPGIPTQRFTVQGGWLERNEGGEFWGRLELEPGLSLVFATDINQSAVSFSPSAPEFVATGWE